MKNILIALLILVIGPLTSSAQGEEVKSFCSYGTSISPEIISADGALWDMSWGSKSWEWHDCDATPNVNILNMNVGGLLRTIVSGPPQIDGDYILRLPFDGDIILTARNKDNPGNVTGQIIGEVDCLFIADLNADHAVVDVDAGTITIIFGASLHDDAYAWITVRKTTGKFKSIHTVDLWRLDTSGTITIALVPDLDLQTNILYALKNPELVLGGEDETVLSGSYYHNSGLNN